MTEKLMYLLVRDDLPADTPPGKLMVQAGHGFLHAWIEAHQKDPDGALAYAETPEHKKIVLRVPDEATLWDLNYLCAGQGVPRHLVTDFAYTVFDKPTVTVLGIGPISRETADRLGLHRFKRY